MSIPQLFDLPTLDLIDPKNHLHLTLTSSLHLQLPDSFCIMPASLRGLELIRGAGLCLKIKLRWNNHRVPEGLVEAFGEWVSSAEMWSQLLFSTGLQVPVRVGEGGDDKGEGPDIIIDLTRSSPTPAATELLLPTILPVASLMCITLNFSFSREGLLRDHKALPGLLELMPLTDTAFRGLWNNKIASLAPVLGKVRYLEEVSEKAEYVSVVVDAIMSVAERSEDIVLKGRVEDLEVRGSVEDLEGRKGGAGGVERSVWSVMLGVLKEKGGRGRGLKSMVVVDGQVAESKGEGGLEDSLLLDEEGVVEGGTEGGDEDILLEDTETEDELFRWNCEDRNYEYDEEDSFFTWDNDNESEEGDDTCLFEDLEGRNMELSYSRDESDDTCLFQAFEDPEMRIGYCRAEKDELLFMDDSELVLNEALLPHSEEEDMMWI